MFTPARPPRESSNNCSARAVISVLACRRFSLIARRSSASAILSPIRIFLRFSVASLSFFIARFAASLATSSSFFDTMKSFIVSFRCACFSRKMAISLGSKYVDRLALLWFSSACTSVEFPEALAAAPSELSATTVSAGRVSLVAFEACSSVARAASPAGASGSLSASISSSATFSSASTSCKSAISSSAASRSPAVSSCRSASASDRRPLTEVYSSMASSPA
mmetsp:Transcript_6105/g.14062  ORF Transcript_6105/g.14062 Transcript_6105/m.14062 type:complete len:223 (-) Transcript_6105:148-816(-)